MSPAAARAGSSSHQRSSSRSRRAGDSPAPATDGSMTIRSCPSAASETVEPTGPRSSRSGRRARGPPPPRGRPAVGGFNRVGHGAVAGGQDSHAPVPEDRMLAADGDGGAEEPAHLPVSGFGIHGVGPAAVRYEV